MKERKSEVYGLEHHHIKLSRYMTVSQKKTNARMILMLSDIYRINLQKRKRRGGEDDFMN